MTQKIQTAQKTDTDVERYSTKQVKESGIITIFIGGGWGEGAS